MLMSFLSVIERFVKGGIGAQQEVNKIIAKDKESQITPKELGCFLATAVNEIPKLMAKGKEVQITPTTVLVQRKHRNGRRKVRIFNVHKQIENAIKKDSFLKYRIDYLMELPHKKRFPAAQINAIAKQAGITRTQVHNYIKKQRANRNKTNKPIVNGELFEEKEKAIAG
jgi:hypothetical protein